jgi:LysR family transcriptional activator of nhaA
MLGETGISFFGTKSLVGRYRGAFPLSLDGAPLLLPLEQLALRRSLNQWFDRHDIKPRVVAEFADSALMEVFGADGVGIFAAPTVMQDDVRRQYGLHVLGHVPEVRQRFYAISIERKLKNPAVVAISDGARHEIFSKSEPGPSKRAGR